MDEVASTRNLCLYSDGTVKQAFLMQEGGEDVEWKTVGYIDDDYWVNPLHEREFAYLQSEWIDNQRQRGETELAGSVAYFSSRGEF